MSGWILKTSKGGNSATILVSVLCCTAFLLRKGLVCWCLFGLAFILLIIMSNLNSIRQHLLSLPLLYCLPLLRRHLQWDHSLIFHLATLGCLFQLMNADSNLHVHIMLYLSNLRPIWGLLLKKWFAFLSSEWCYPQTTRAAGAEFFVPNCEGWRLPNIPGRHCFFILHISIHSVAEWGSTWFRLNATVCLNWCKQTLSGAWHKTGSSSN